MLAGVVLRGMWQAASVDFGVVLKELSPGLRAYVPCLSLLLQIIDYSVLVALDYEKGEITVGIIDYVRGASLAHVPTRRCSPFPSPPPHTHTRTHMPFAYNHAHPQHHPPSLVYVTPPTPSHAFFPLSWLRKSTLSFVDVHLIAYNRNPSNDNNNNNNNNNTHTHTPPHRNTHGSGATLSRALTRPPLDVLSQVFADGAPGFPFQALHAVNMDGGGSTTLSASPDWPTQPAQVQLCCCWDSSSCCGRLVLKPEVKPVFRVLEHVLRVCRGLGGGWAT